MSYEETKKRVEARFKRELSDREIIESLSEWYEQTEDTFKGLEDDIMHLESENEKLRKVYCKLPGNLGDRLAEILSVKAESYLITIRINDAETPTIDYTVRGEYL